VRAPLETFAGLLDRSVQEIAAAVAEPRNFDAARVGALADIWDNNTFPLVSVACAPRLLRGRQARTGLRWMADLGAARRALMVDLDPALDRRLPPAAAERSVYRDYQARVYPGSFAVTTEIIAALATDYDLADASVRQITVRPGEAGLRVEMTVAAPRRFVPSTGRVARDGTRQPWPAAPLRFTFIGVTDLRFDACDGHGVSLTAGDARVAITIGQQGTVQATEASVWPDDPVWHESSAGRAADAVTPQERSNRRPAGPTSSLTGQQRAAARAMTELMQRIRMVGYYPALAATIPVQQMCRVAADAGSAILAASAKRGPAREQAFADLAQQWRNTSPTFPPAPVPSGPANLRYLSYAAQHEAHDVQRDGVAVLVAAVPDTDPAAPWRLASEKLPQPARFHITTAAFGGTHEIDRVSGAATMNGMLIGSETP
jgi:hypothetical protein